MSKKQVCEKRKDIKRIARIKRSSRFIGGIALLGALSLSLAGCHGQQERVSFHVPDTFDESRQFDLTFWAKNDTNKTQTAIYEKAIADFEKLGESDPMFAKLAEITARNNGLWSPEAEKYLLAEMEKRA